MKIVIVDDEQFAVEVLKRLLIRFEDVEVVECFTNPEEALASMKTLEADALLVDMEMQGLHGLDFVEKLLEIKSELEIVFVTAHSQYAVEAFGVNAIDYLLKPVTINRLEKSIQKLIQRQEMKAHFNASTSTETPNTLKIFAMGQLRVLDEQLNNLKWRTRKCKELFIYLWRYNGSSQKKVKLVEDLWPNMEASRSSALLHTTVYQLRKLLKASGFPDAIRSENEDYKLDVAIESDLEKIIKITKDTAINRDQVESLLELYQGHYLEGEDYPWIFYERQEIAKQVLFYLEKFLIFEKKNKSVTELNEKVHRKMIQMDPLNEDYAHLFLEYYGENGHRAAFIEFYDNFKRRLKEELDIEPQSKLVKIYEKYFKN